MSPVHCIYHYPKSWKISSLLFMEEMVGSSPQTRLATHVHLLKLSC